VRTDSAVEPSPAASGRPDPAAERRADASAHRRPLAHARRRLAAHAHRRPLGDARRRLATDARQPWALALLVAAPLVVAYLILAPPAGDLAAATYRSDLFARAGFTTWDTGWYAAHGYWLPSYSLLSPALGAWLGVRTLLALSALAACALFGAIAERVFALAAARVAAVVFALGFCVSLLSGRVPFDLGFAIGLAALLALLGGALAPALALAALTSAASPVAGAFLALAGAAGALGGGSPRERHERTDAPQGQRERAGAPREQNEPAGAPRGRERAGTQAGWRPWALLAGAALAPIVLLGLAYPNGGYEPFAAGAFWPALAALVLVALLLPPGGLGERGRRVIRAGAALYALALVAAYVARTPMGGNAARLGALLGAPLLAGALWRQHRRALAVLAAPLLYWQLATPIRDYAALAGDASLHSSYYRPARVELRRLTAGTGTIVEVPMTRAHWESAYLAGYGGIALARGWERQLDTRFAAIFYRPALTPAAYLAWLRANRVRYVALPDAPLDRAGAREGRLIARGLPYLHELWRSAHWRIYRVGR
jgi:hypothetical protein